MDALLKWVDSANGVLWNTVLIVMLCGTGIFYTFKLRFIQVDVYKRQAGAPERGCAVL